MNESTDTVSVAENTGEVTLSEAVETGEAIVENKEVSETQEGQSPEQKVPLSALQKERKKRQEVEQRNKILEEFQLKQMKSQDNPQESDGSEYEPVTKKELEHRERVVRAETVRDVEERLWIKQNPERLEAVLDKLPDFLKQRPNLAAAINEASNRYEEAWELMDKLTPKQKSNLKGSSSSVHKEAPNSPSNVPKGAAIGQVADLSNMSDAEFNSWRQDKRRRR